MDFVPCVKWVMRGVTRDSPVKVELTREELQQICLESKPDREDEINTSDDENGSDLYNFENYDQEEEVYSNSLGIGSLALYDNNERDANINIPGMDDEDTDDEDDLIKPTDNLILVGKGLRDNSSMENIEVHVFNEEQGEMYAHHDIMVESCPLCLELVATETDGLLSSYIVAGLMSSRIHLYDINVINPVKPQATLGSKKQVSKKGHTDAVLDLSWNRSYPHILASSSADKTVALWDLETTSLSNKFDDFTGNVENIQWDSESGHCLLSCDSSGSVKIVDCRQYCTVKNWTVTGEALISRWMTDDPSHFLVGTSKGKLYNFDLRMDSHVFKIKAHESDVTSVSSIQGYKGLIVTSCVGGDVSVWDVNTDPKRVIFKKSLCVEQLHALDLNPDNPLLAAVGGAKKKGSYFSVINLNKNNSLSQVLNFRRC